MCNRMKPQEESNPMAYDMTLRDQFAMAALPALISDPQSVAHPIGHARLAYEYADAMLKARNKGQI